jgi:hypothetical protein
MTTVCIFGAAAEPGVEGLEKTGAASPHLWGYTPKSLSDLVGAVGFKDIQILPATGPHPGKNFRLEAVKG